MTTTDVADLVARLRAACNGHPHAKIPWPHRLLHEAAEALEHFYYSELEHEHLGCPTAKTGIYAEEKRK